MKKQAIELRFLLDKFLKWVRVNFSLPPIILTVISMKLNNQSQIRRNAYWLLRLIVLPIAITTFGGLLSGCDYPCAIIGVCGDPPPYSTEKIVPFMGKDGAVYFDIPARKNYKRIVIKAIIVYREGNGYLYWVLDMNDGQDVPLPFRYGQEIPKAIVRMKPKTIENGEYRITVTAYLYDEKMGRQAFVLSGRFRYENGAVRNYYTTR
jgi:hypothetical protein